MSDIIVRNIPRVKMTHISDVRSVDGGKILNVMDKLNCWECLQLGWNKYEEPSHCCYYCIGKGCVAITEYALRWCPEGRQPKEVER